ncbi:hypothetical protein SCOCK_230084 [Actinacidiphila cocklensis]|uniref:Uncharacterized protein n=1 Tax=Actinacidiphila cocklensis TaxID=887465 RepID=A0A9W4DPZ9_9ACTN|nr:hypothetical protein SCOCK_230084 [Actinacidiphila cocklensis]
MDGVLPQAGRALPAHHRAGGEVLRLRRLRAQRRLALQRHRGPRPLRETARPRRGRGVAAGDERHRRGGGPGRRGRGHRRGHPAGRRPGSGVLPRAVGAAAGVPRAGGGVRREGPGADGRGGVGAADQGGGHGRRELDPARRPRAAGEAAAGAGRGGGAAGGDHPRVDGGDRDPPQARGHAVRHGPGALRAALHRGLHRVGEGAAPHLAADELLDDRDRAAAARAVGDDRLGGRRDAGRPGARVHVRAAHRRRPDRAGRARGPVPLRLAHRQRRADLGAYGRRAAGGAGAALPRHRRGGGRARLVGGAGGAAGLVRECPAGPYDGPGLGGRLRRQRGGDVQPGRPYAAGPGAAGLGPGPRHGADGAAVGGPPGAALGARAAALGGGARDVRGLPGRGPAGAGGAERGDRPGGALRRPDLGPALSALPPGSPVGTERFAARIPGRRRGVTNRTSGVPGRRA